jgi:hypothetical protein
MFLNTFELHAKGKIFRFVIATKREIYKLDDKILKERNVYSHRLIEKVKLTKQDGVFKDNEIFQDFCIFEKKENPKFVAQYSL